MWLRELQRILRQMIAGECKPTTPEWNAAIATKPGGLPVVGASQLKASIPHMFLWIDYCAHSHRLHIRFEGRQPTAHIVALSPTP